MRNCFNFPFLLFINSTKILQPKRKPSIYFRKYTSFLVTILSKECLITFIVSYLKTTRGIISLNYLTNFGLKGSMIDYNFMIKLDVKGMYYNHPLIYKYFIG